MSKIDCQFFYDWLEKAVGFSAKEKGNLIDTILIYAQSNWEDISSDDFDCFRNRIESYRGRPGASAGESHWNWKGGITPQNQKERSSQAYAEWRKAVFERDNFTCQICGQVGGGLNAHHIEPWSTNVNLRYQIDNGITLCKKCHVEIHRKDVV